jgi:hypothetical protein
MLGATPHELVSTDPDANDWYCDVFRVDRRKCLLLMHAGTMLAVFVPDVRKADLSSLGPFVVVHVQQALAAEQLLPDVLGTLDPTSLRLGKTASRSLLGCMRHDRELLQHMVAVGGGLAKCDASALNQVLRRTVHLPGGRGAVFPLNEARRHAQP